MVKEGTRMCHRERDRNLSTAVACEETNMKMSVYSKEASMEHLDCRKLKRGQARKVGCACS